ncbi:MAG: DUF5071 domain-containing protein [Crocinitomix sp.]|nr:DUF5071 domain-containing protein [Crocinitomix sp.]
MGKSELIPSHKDDQVAMKKLRECSFEQIEPIANELLGWLQDGHWPVAGPIGEILKPYTLELSPQIMNILKGNDYEWKYFLINRLVNQTGNKFSEEVLEELNRIVEKPTEVEISTEVHWITKFMLTGNE